MSKSFVLLFVSLWSAAAQNHYVNANIVSEGSVNGCSDSGVVNAYLCSHAAGSQVSGYYPNQTYTLHIAHTNTGPATLAVDTLAAVPIKKMVGGTLLDPAPGDLPAGAVVPLSYDGVQFQLTTSTTDPRVNQLPTVSAANPLYAYFPFRDDDQSLYGAISFNGSDFRYLSAAPLASFTERDASWMYNSASKTFYFVSTGGTAAGGFQFWSSTDLKTFTTPTTVTVPNGLSSPTNTWAPEFFHDPVSGNDYVIVAMSNNNYQTFTNYLIGFTAATGTFAGTSTALTINGSANYHIDPFLYYNGGTYYLFYSDPGSGQKLAYATAASLTGTYTQTLPAGTDFGGFAAAAGGANVVEAPSVVDLPNGCTRVYVDTQLATTYHHIVYFADSCNHFATWTTPKALDIARAEQGTVVAVTDPTEAAVLLNAGNSAAQSWAPSGWGVGGPNKNWTFEAISKAASFTFGNNEAATIAANPGSGNDAVLAACDPASGNTYCQMPAPSAGTWSLFSNSALGSNFRIANSNAANKSEMAFMDGVTSFAGGTGNTAQAAHAWWLGENASFLTPGSNYFYLYNGNTVKGPVFTAGGDTGNFHIMHSLEFSSPTQSVNDSTPYYTLVPSSNPAAMMSFNGTSEFNINGPYATQVLQNTLNTDYTGVFYQSNSVNQSVSLALGNPGSPDPGDFIIRDLTNGVRLRFLAGGGMRFATGASNNSDVLELNSGNSAKTGLLFTNTNTTNTTGGIHNTYVDSFTGGFGVYDLTTTTDLFRYLYTTSSFNVTGDVVATGRLITSQATPAGSSAACTAGETWADDNYLYHCTSTLAIKRVALTSF